ncbi:hypothetical protein K6959_11565 [Bacillus aquiflavi]|uniref:Imm64 family immunity protein n=1 Tax=Bacillus aquiflavi TaxID=2672567 RepID=UPI001CA88BD3|nr:Imm64 family immunity protein [Bacillus aquiflavi]UAC47344.1 hypothetical protein K6959_11565 [Bacillus aquiflavi]
MGSNISLGIVYASKQLANAENITRNVSNLFVSDDGYIKSFKYSTDLQGTKWKEFSGINSELAKSMYSSLINSYYGSITIMSNLFNEKLKEMVISIEVTNEYFGFLVDIKEELLEGINLDELEENIINFFMKNYECLKFNYAFCDHEAEIEFSPDEIAHMTDEVYSILLLQVNNELVLEKSSWKIDGLTER